MDKITLSSAESDEVARLADEVLGDGDSWDPLTFVDRAGRVAERLPLRLREFLAEVRANESDVTVVSGLPIADDLVPTPTGWDTAAKTGAGQREEIVLLLVGSALGEAFGWANQQDGRIVHDVCPAPGMERSLTSASSEAGLSLHTEDVFHPCRGDYVSLLCLRNPDSVGTTFVRIAALDLPEQTRKVLSENRFRFYPDDSHVGGVLLDGDGTDHLAGRGHTTGSVIFGPHERPYLRFDIDFMAVEEGDTEAAAVMAATQEHLSAAVERVVLQPGDAVFVDNYRVVHGREPFQPRYDGKDRWLKRLNLIRNVRSIYALSDRRSRIIA
ncbi:TauD/TfdA family dioxygenase [Allokutzneria albata]|uniref:Arginine beta-hydroxylase, Fe(II)/alpha-ketoglutarate-dependent n=1 Tax=Allokutzneria albata TaxID=211114 RepID=A0A1G9UCE8_ALLAB|nr:TauD/TfdA family dioxygenase [Allokutzneria albata]SDM57616.1 arginine beta-hydroxylase, Fe(II)/alpha-ketoglutarate-dependent [Allokutzneria albata]